MWEWGRACGGGGWEETLSGALSGALAKRDGRVRVGVRVRAWGQHLSPCRPVVLSQEGDGRNLPQRTQRAQRGPGTSGVFDQAFHGQSDEQGGENAEQRAVQDILGVGLVRLAFAEPQNRLGGKQKAQGVESAEQDEDEDQGSFDVADLANSSVTTFSNAGSWFSMVAHTMEGSTPKYW